MPNNYFLIDEKINHNIYNEESFDRFFDRMATLSSKENVRTWVTTTFKRWVRRQPRFFKTVVDKHPEGPEADRAKAEARDVNSIYYPYGRYFLWPLDPKDGDEPWAFKALAEGRLHWFHSPTGPWPWVLCLQHFIDYLNAHDNGKPIRHSVPQLAMLVDAWDRQRDSARNATE